MRPGQPAGFSPNGILQVTPEFLEGVILQVKAAGFRLHRTRRCSKRLKSPVPARPFAAFTLDDGYRDNRYYAYPVFKRHGVPFTIYVSSDYADGKGDLWWLNLEAALRGLGRVQLDMRGELWLLWRTMHNEPPRSHETNRRWPVRCPSWMPGRWCSTFHARRVLIRSALPRPRHDVG